MIVLNISGIWYKEKMLLNKSKVIKGFVKNEKIGLMVGLKMIFF